MTDDCGELLHDDVHQDATLANIDHSGKFPAMIPAARQLGNVPGPNIAAAVSGHGLGYDGVFTFSESRPSSQCSSTSKCT